MRVVETETQSVSSYVDLMKKVILLIGDKNLSTCKIAGKVLVTEGKVKVKVEHLYSAPKYRHCHLRGAQIHCMHQAASHIPALYLPSRCRYSFPDPKRMEG